MKWDECFIEICKSLYRIKVTCSSGTYFATGFIIGKFNASEKKVDFILSTARHVLDVLPEYETIHWEVERFDWKGEIINKISFKTNIEATGVSAIRLHKQFDVGCISIPYFVNNGENFPVRVIDPRATIMPGARVGWAGFPGFSEKKILRSHPCYFEGVVSTVVDRDQRLFFLVDGHGGQGVSGGPLWYWNDETSNYEVIGICSQYLFSGEERALPGLVVFESINPLVAYLQSSSDLVIDIIY